MTRPNKGDEFQVTVESLAFGGKGVALLEDYAVFNSGAIPNQKVKARITKRRRGYAEARILEILKESPQSIDARCGHFPTCLLYTSPSPRDRQ